MMKHLIQIATGELFGFDGGDETQEALFEEKLASGDFRVPSDAEVAAIQNPVETQQDALARAIVDVRTQRAPILDALTGIGFAAMVAADSETAQNVVQCRQALLDITSLPAFTNATTYDDMKAAILTQYRVIAAGANSNVQGAFAALVS